MESIRKYLIAIVAACMILVIATALIQNERMRRIIRFLGGILIILVAVTPLLSLDVEELVQAMQSFDSAYAFDSETIQNNTQMLLAKHIKETTETYIENKADEIGATVQAEVTLDGGEYPIPTAARIIGSLNAEQVRELSSYLTDALGIPAEKQEWSLYETGG